MFIVDDAYAPLKFPIPDDTYSIDGHTLSERDTQYSVTLNTGDVVHFIEARPEGSKPYLVSFDDITAETVDLVEKYTGLKVLDKKLS